MACLKYFSLLSHERFGSSASVMYCPTCKHSRVGFAFLGAMDSLGVVVFGMADLGKIGELTTPPYAGRPRDGSSALYLTNYVLLGLPAYSEVVIPDLSEIGHPEHYYAKGYCSPYKRRNLRERTFKDSAKYIALALNPNLSWDNKLKYFKHAIKRRCVPPPYPDDAVFNFYRKLADSACRFTGQEALKLTSQEDDLYAAHLSMGRGHEGIEDDAEDFSTKLMPEGDRCPEWFNESDWLPNEAHSGSMDITAHQRAARNVQISGIVAPIRQEP